MELRQRKLEELNVRVDVDEKSVALVMVIFTELQQVLLNFAINAEQAIVHGRGERRQVVIRTGDRIGYRRAPSGGAVFFFELPIVPAV